MFRLSNTLVVDRVKLLIINYLYIVMQMNFNIQVVGTRDDPIMEDKYLNNPVEYTPKQNI